MSRPGLTYQDIANAASQLDLQGIHPTIERVRHITGSGSSSTIAMHLKAWKSAQNTIKPLREQPIPHELQATVNHLWERLAQSADEEIKKISQSYDDKVSELSDHIHQAETQYKELMTLQNQTQEEKDIALKKLQESEELIAVQNDSLLTASRQNEKLDEQIYEKEKRIDELRDLNQQVQENLEHYRESAREQRMIDQARHEQAQNQAQIQVVQLQNAFAGAESERVRLKTAYELLSHDYMIVKTNNESLQNELMETKTTNAKLSEMKDYWQKQAEVFSLDLQAKNEVYLTLKQNVMFMEEKFKEAESKLDLLKEQNQVLVNEKWNLGQEIAELRGEMKYVQNLKVTG